MSGLAAGRATFTEVVRARRMVRAYDGRELARGVLDHLLDLALRAPSAGNAQGVDLLVLTRPADRARFWRATSDDVDAPDAWLAGMMTAPALVVCLADPQAYARRYAAADKAAAARRQGVDGGDPGADLGRWPVAWWDVDAGMAAQLLLLGAVEAGLGACLFGVPAPRHDAVLREFSVPPGRRAVAVVSLGHAAPGARSRSSRSRRRTTADAVHDGAFGAPAVRPDRPGVSVRAGSVQGP